MPENWQQGGFGLYIHWPFCASKCPYCDFNSHVTDRVDQERWKRAYLASIDRYAEETPGRLLTSIYIGGGTPSLMQPALVAAILERTAKHWVLANDVEITLEANPTSIEAGRFAGYRDAGANRVSIGIQALADADLRRLGRLHTAAEALRALDIARSTFDRVNFDLIYARQDQTLADWRAELTDALAVEPTHLSLYQLTIEQGTAFGDRFSRGKLTGLPDDDLGADMYLLTQELCEHAGLPAYEVSNHAKPGFESRHNMIYWRGGDYIGIGPGAHGRLGLDGARYATQTPMLPEKWITAVETGGAGESARTTLSAGDQAGEYVMMGLRILDGLDLDRLENLHPGYLNTNKINMLVDLNMISLDGRALRATPKGRPLLNAVIRELLPD